MQAKKCVGGYSAKHLLTLLYALPAWMQNAEVEAQLHEAQQQVASLRKSLEAAEADAAAAKAAAAEAQAGMTDAKEQLTAARDALELSNQKVWRSAWSSGPTLHGQDPCMLEGHVQQLSGRSMCYQFTRPSTYAEIMLAHHN